MTFTDKQLANWRKYEKVRRSGRYNMILDISLARNAARLTEDEYNFCVNHYSSLRLAAESEEQLNRMGE